MAGARLFLLLALGAASAGPCGAQMLRGYSGYFASSSSWSMDRDGRVHEELHKVSSETSFHDGVATQHAQSEVACADGLCSQTVRVSKPGSVTVVAQQGPAAQQGPGPEVGAVPPPMGLRIRAMLQNIALPKIYVERRPSTVLFLAPRPATAQATKLVEPKPIAEDLGVAALLGASGSLLALIVVANLKCRRSDAREVPLSVLSEPLAPIQEEVTVLPTAVLAFPVAPKAADNSGIADCLAQLYACAILKANAAATAKYLSRVYARASA